MVLTARREEAERTIIEALLALPEYLAARTVFCYVGVKEELRTMPFIQAALADGKKICAPKCLDGLEMEAREITGPEDLAYGAYGLLEPIADCPAVKPADIDMAVVPCLGCDLRGNRLGYGAGYYDRYMAGARYPKVGICTESALFSDLPTADHDIAVGIVVTERRVYRV